MTTLNKVTLIGYLGRGPEMRSTAAGDPVTQLVIATTETWKDKNTGEKKENTEWHRVSLYRKLADIAGKYLKKGSLVYIEGRLQTRKWTGKDDIERYTVEIIADDMRMLGGKPSHADADGETHKSDDAGSGKAGKQSTRSDRVEFDLEDDMIPF